MERVAWEGSLHQSVRVLGSASRPQSANLPVFLSMDGATPNEVLARLPFEQSRSASPGDLPDPKRYRDGRQVCQFLGMVYEEDDGRVRVTDWGRAVGRWLPRVTPANAAVLGRHAAAALSGSQLRNPSRAGAKYDVSMKVFPNAFIWRAMLALDDVLSSDELNRAILACKDESGLEVAILRIREARAMDDPSLLGPETIEGTRKNDRIIPWMAMASFGWLLIIEKEEDEERKWYRIRPNCKAILREASRIRHEHRSFSTMSAYVQHLARLAAVPPDLR